MSDEIIQLLLPFIKKSKDILILQDAIESGGIENSNRKKAQDQISEIDSSFTEEANKLIYYILKASKEKFGSKKLDNFISDFFLIISSALEGEENDLNKRAVSLASEKMTALAVKQQSKSQYRRWLEFNSIIVFFAILLVVYFGVRIYSKVPTHETIESRSELIDGFNALEKIVRYDSWMSAKVRKGGWIKSILLWPIQPTDAEIQSASKYLLVVTVVYNYGVEKGAICNKDLVGTLENAPLDIQIDVATLVGEFVQTSNLNEIAELIVDPLVQRFPCP